MTSAAQDHPAAEASGVGSAGPAAAAAVPVVIVGAGPVGLTLALRLAQFGVPSTVLERGGRLRGEGSKALCMQRETLEAWAQVGGPALAAAVAERGTAWSLGRTYFRDTELFTTTLPADGEHFPPFVNVSQTEVEALLVAAAEAEPAIRLRWDWPVESLHLGVDSVGSAGSAGELLSAYVVGADGARSAVRRAVGIDFPGHSHDDRFLIADIRARLPFPAERRFWFDPPWNPGRSVLIHPQPDDVWRIDWQVPPDFDLPGEQANGGLDARIRAIVGDAAYEPVWLTVYRFHQRVAERLRSGRVLLAGDAAHLMSPFGARGMNSGVADAMDLAWRLAGALADPAAADELLDGYDGERRQAAVDNVAVTDATMRFMVPPDPAARAERDAILRASVDDPEQRARVDSGRLYRPAHYSWAGPPPVGDVLPDAPVDPVRGTTARRLRDLLPAGWLTLTVAGDGASRPRHPSSRDSAPTVDASDGGTPGSSGRRMGTVGETGAGVVLLGPGDPVPGDAAPTDPGSVAGLAIVRDPTGLAVARLGGPGRTLVVRPDGYVAEVREYDAVRSGEADGAATAPPPT